MHHICAFPEGQALPLDQPLAQVARTFDLTLEHLHALKSGAAHVQVEEIERLLNHLGYEISELRVERRSG